jgi:hypothetical protein
VRVLYEEPSEFRIEVFEIADMCDEVMTDLAMTPSERFYPGELIALQAIAIGLYAKNQTVLDWLFDLRRLTKENLEGMVVMRRGVPCHYRRLMSIPPEALRIR